MRRVGIAAVLLVGLSACASAGSGGTSDTGVTGMTVKAPSCPVQSTTSPCEPTGVAVDVQVVKQGSSSVVGSATSSSDGSFRIAVPAGTYVVRATLTDGVPQPQSKQAVVTVDDGAFTKVTLTFDSGIRIMM